jgi:hypothetical protein
VIRENIDFEAPHDEKENQDIVVVRPTPVSRFTTDNDVDVNEPELEPTSLTKVSPDSIQNP